MFVHQKQLPWNFFCVLFQHLCACRPTESDKLWMAENWFNNIFQPISRLHVYTRETKYKYLKGRNFRGKKYFQNLISRILALSAKLNSAKLDFFLPLGKEGQNGRDIRVKMGERGQNGQNFYLKIAHPRN